MAFIRNTDKFIEGNKLFFSNERAKAAVQSDLDQLSSEDSAIKLRLDVIEGSGAGSISKAQADAQAYADQKVAALVNSAPEVLDTLKELSDAIGGDASFAATIAGQIGAVDAKVDQEILDRQAAITSVNQYLETLEADIIAGDSLLQTQLDAEVDRATAAEDLLNVRLDQCFDFASSTDNALVIVQEQMAQEISDRQAGDAALQAQLDAASSVVAANSLVKRDGSGQSDFNIIYLYPESEGPNPSRYGYADENEIGMWDSSAHTMAALRHTHLRIMEPGKDSMLTPGVLKLRVGTDPSMPVAPEDVTVKSYVDAADALLSSRIDALESAPGPDVDKAYVDAQDSALDGRITTAEGNIAGIIGSLDYVSNYAQTALLKLDGTSEMRGNINLGSPITPVTEVTVELTQPKEFYFQFENLSNFQTFYSGAVAYESGQHIISVADIWASGGFSEPLFQPETISLVNNNGDILGTWSISSGPVSNDPDLSFSVALGALTLINKVINLAEPTTSSDAATKGYVDGQVSGLQGQIDTEKGRIDAILSAADADKDSFAEIVQLINSVDTSNDSAFASYVLSNDAALAQEVSDRQAGDSALSSRLDVLEQDPTTKTYVDGVQSALDARIDSLELDSVTKAYVDSSKLSENIQTISASTSVSSSSTTQIFFCNVSGGSVTVTLPSATAVVPGRKFVVKDTGSSSPSGNSIVVAAQAGQTVDGQSSFEMRMPFEAAQFVSDGSQWFVM